MNTVYENSVIESKMTELIDSRLKVRSVLTVDNSLREGVGLTKTINKYTYNGKAEELAKGSSNSVVGSVAFTPSSYVVKRIQQTFTYNDMDILADPYMLDAGMTGASAVMVNQILDEYFGELSGVTNRHTIAGDAVAYDDIVDALAYLDREVEEGMVIIMGSGARKAIRSDADFIASRQGEILYTGQFGTLCGLPVIFSKKVPSALVIITSKDAVRFFVKREATVEQDRNIETKQNTVVYERHGLIALVDDTSSVILGKAAPAVTYGAANGAATGTKKFTLASSLATGQKLWVRKNCDAPVLGEQLSARFWTEYESGADVEVVSGDKVVLAITGADGVAYASRYSVA